MLDGLRSSHQHRPYRQLPPREHTHADCLYDVVLLKWSLLRSKRKGEAVYHRARAPAVLHRCLPPRGGRCPSWCRRAERVRHE